jgi:DNA-binding response OmpR family regulator
LWSNLKNCIDSELAMLPRTLALVDDDKQYTGLLSQHLKALDVQVDVFADSNDLIALGSPYSYGFYIIDLILPGVDGVDLIKVIRKRSNAGVLVVSGRLEPEVFQQVIEAGADMYLAKPVQFEQIVLATRAVQRRVGGNGNVKLGWILDRRLSQLIAPEGSRVDLSAIDLALVECFARANGEVVERETLQHCIGQDAEQDAGQDVSSNLNATIYRLRRRIERATPSAVPLQTKSRVGYLFRAPLQVI